MRTVQGNWEHFRERVLPHDASERQIAAMQTAFYAGAHAMLHLLLELGDDETLSHDAVEMIVDGLRKETRAYGESLTD